MKSFVFLSLLFAATPVFAEPARNDMGPGGGEGYFAGLNDRVAEYMNATNNGALNYPGALNKTKITRPHHRPQNRTGENSRPGWFFRHRKPENMAVKSGSPIAPASVATPATPVAPAFAALDTASAVDAIARRKDASGDFSSKNQPMPNNRGSYHRGRPAVASARPVARRKDASADDTSKNQPMPNNRGFYHRGRPAVASAAPLQRINQRGVAGADDGKRHGKKKHHSSAPALRNARPAATAHPRARREAKGDDGKHGTGKHSSAVAPQGPSLAVPSGGVRGFRGHKQHYD